MTLPGTGERFHYGMSPTEHGNVRRWASIPQLFAGLLGERVTYDTLAILFLITLQSFLHGSKSDSSA